MSLEGQKCCAEVGGSWVDFGTGKRKVNTCTHKAKVEFDGKPYCNVHNPAKQIERRRISSLELKISMKRSEIKTLKFAIADCVVQTRTVNRGTTDLINKVDALVAEIKALQVEIDG